MNFLRGASVMAALLIVANIVSMLTSCDRVEVPTFAECKLASPIVKTWEDGSALRADGCVIDAETRQVRPSVPLWTVVNDASGTWTLTPDTGWRRCEHGSTRSCDGTEFLPGGTGR